MITRSSARSCGRSWPQEPDLHVVGEAADGAEAIRLAQELRPDILLLDLGMPRVNGLEVLRWSKAEHPESKVIIVTVHTEDAYRQAAEASGADAFLLKRTLGTDLLPTIQRLRGSLAPPHKPRPLNLSQFVEDHNGPSTSQILPS